MIVYPHGCLEVENIVLFLAAQLNSIGFEVLTDILQTQRIAKEGLSTVLVDDFRRSNYVVILCTGAESKFTLNVFVILTIMNLSCGF